MGADGAMPHDWIDVRGARVHNLKNVDVRIPRNRLVVVTGLSGSGKSSLAFDTVYAEGQRRYVESLSAYARQFLEQVEKPDVDQIDGLSPAISIEQRTTGSNPRSTVGTVTEIYDYLRLLFANVGVPHCPSCGREITSQSVASMVETIMAEPVEERVNVLAPIVRGRKGAFKKELAALRARGLTRVRVDGQVRALDEDLQLDRRRNHWIDVVVDRLIVRHGAERRLTESIEYSLSLADDVVVINTFGGGDRLFSRRLACVACGINMPEMTPRAFSFNSPHGACRACQGLGAVEDFDPVRIVPDHSVSLAAGAIQPWSSGDRQLVASALARLSKHFGIDLHAPFRKLPRRHRELLLFGPNGGDSGPASEPAEAPRGARRRGRPDPFGQDFEGIVPNLRRRYRDGSWSQQEALEPYRALRSCTACDGERLRPESRAVRVKGPHAGGLRQPLDCGTRSPAFDAIELTERESRVADRVLREIRDRMGFLCDVGVGYLTLARGATTLSGGEAQRIRLATQIGANLTGVLYVLDEPSIGLHQRDNRLLLSTLSRLRDLGNTVVVVEHDEDTIRAADYVIDLGVGAGEHGGQVIFQGPPTALAADRSDSLTGMYLRGGRSIPVPAARRRARHGTLIIRGARANNLKNIDAGIPIGLFTAVTGVSGSGKSTLVNDILYRALARALYRASDDPGAHAAIEGSEAIDKVIQIDQSPIGRTPRSNPATYTGLFTFIPRDLCDAAGSTGARLSAGTLLLQRQGRAFARRVRATASSPSRCTSCRTSTSRASSARDAGTTGKRSKIAYRGVSIADLLALTVDQALPLLENFPSVATKLRTLEDVGLGYLTLGQSGDHAERRRGRSG